VPKTPQQLVRDEILALQAYQVAEASGMVKLDAMENPYRLPPDLRAEMGRVLAEAEINRYPDPTGTKLRELLKVKMGVPQGMELLLGNGSDDLIQMVTFALAKPGAVVMYPDPTFVMYKMNAILAGAKPVGVPTNPDFSLDREAFMAAIREHQPALVFLAYPNNPTGVLYDADDIAAIARAAEGLVVIDEAYHVFAQQSFMPRLAEFPNLVVMRTVSKLGLAGIRLGYLAARPEWIVQFNKVRQAYNVSVLTQAAAIFVLGKLDVLEAQAGIIRVERVALRDALAAMPGVTVFPTAANFFLVRVPSAGRTFASLKSQGVLVRSFDAAHPMLSNCLRITVGTPEENRILLAALREALDA
jgi:histidinol-phosphate aminotransferase